MTKLGKAIVALQEAMGSRPYVIVYDQAHASQKRACIKGYFGGGYAAALGLAHIAPQFVNQVMTKDDDETETLK